MAYYGLIVAIGHRWRDATLADGSSAIWVSLASVGRAVALWLVGAFLAGSILGALGHEFRSTSRYSGAVAAGLAAGLIGAQAAALMVTVSGWSLLDQLGWSLFIAAGITMSLSALTPAVMLRRANRSTSWPAYWITAVLAICLTAAAWSRLDVLRSLI